MKILSISDKIVPFIYSPTVVKKFGHVDFVVACGDLPYYYQEFIISTLNKPLFFVHGNHDPHTEYSDYSECTQPRGGIDLHRRVRMYAGMTLAGVAGSIRYNKKAVYQYTQGQMWYHVFSLVPGLFLNRLLYGRYLDLFVTHSPSWKIHDGEDFPHQGIKAFRWLVQVFKPRIHFHGHTHVYRPDTVIETRMGTTRVLNTFGYLETEVDIPAWRYIGKKDPGDGPVGKDLG